MGIFDKLFKVGKKKIILEAKKKIREKANVEKDDGLSTELRKKLEDFKKEQGISNDSDWEEFKESIGVETDSDFIEWAEDDSHDDKLFKWVTVPGHHCGDDNPEYDGEPHRGVCSDCQKRNGMIKTHKEWEEIGLPGDERLMCEPHEKTDWGCYCVLDIIEDE